MIKYLVSTNETQGQRKNDFCFVPEGEILKFGSECCGENIDGNCGCRRSMIGINNMKATTTMKIVELSLTEEELINITLKSDLEAWKSIVDEEWKQWVKEDVKELIRIANTYPTNSVLEKRGDRFLNRVCIKV